VSSLAELPLLSASSHNTIIWFWNTIRMQLYHQSPSLSLLGHAHSGLHSSKVMIQKHCRLLMGQRPHRLWAWKSLQQCTRWHTSLFHEVVWKTDQTIYNMNLKRSKVAFVICCCSFTHAVLINSCSHPEWGVGGCYCLHLLCIFILIGSSYMCNCRPTHL